MRTQVNHIALLAEESEVIGHEHLCASDVAPGYVSGPHRAVTRTPKSCAAGNSHPGLPEADAVESRENATVDCVPAIKAGAREVAARGLAVLPCLSR